ncbi:hypothetical protein [Risungbinella massiliensis]|uniref:hypothetical protein n=1 Tax=Risungbinella massiliensis TaxID=1329796 RepID=UPI0005CC1D63|nr:hypothetical protein [Risungbinella massiliensis]
MPLQKHFQEKVEKTKEHYGRIDVFIHKAGVKGVFFGLKYVLDIMKKQKSERLCSVSTGIYLGE